MCLCLSLRVFGTGNRERKSCCVFALADMVDMLPAIVTQRRPGIKEASEALVPRVVKQSHMTGVTFQTLEL